MFTIGRIKALVPAQARRLVRKVLDALSPNESLAQSKEKWNSLARENARYYVLTDEGEGIDEESFRRAGERDVENLVDLDMLLRRLAPFAARSVLEIGCGAGRLTEFLCRRFRSVSAVDISEEMITLARRRLEGLRNCDLRATDGKTFPFPDAHFDLVFSYIVFQHMPDRKTVRSNLEETARVLKEGGIAKIQLRGAPTTRGRWFYGAHFDPTDVEWLLRNLPLHPLRTDGGGTRYFWLWLEKPPPDRS